MRSARAIQLRKSGPRLSCGTPGWRLWFPGDPLAARLRHVHGLRELPAHGQVARQGHVPRGLLRLGRERPVLEVPARGGHRDRRQQGFLVARERLHQGEPSANGEDRGLRALLHAPLDEVARGLLGEAAVLEAHPVEHECHEVERRALAFGGRSGGLRRPDRRDGCPIRAPAPAASIVPATRRDGTTAPRSAGRSRRPAALRPWRSRTGRPFLSRATTSRSTTAVPVRNSGAPWGLWAATLATESGVTRATDRTIAAKAANRRIGDTPWSSRLGECTCRAVHGKVAFASERRQRSAVSPNEDGGVASWSRGGSTLESAPAIDSKALIRHLAPGAGPESAEGVPGIAVLADSSATVRLRGNPSESTNVAGGGGMRRA